MKHGGESADVGKFPSI